MTSLDSGRCLAYLLKSFSCDQFKLNGCNTELQPRYQWRNAARQPGAASGAHHQAPARVGKLQITVLPNHLEHTQCCYLTPIWSCWACRFALVGREDGVGPSDRGGADHQAEADRRGLQEGFAGRGGVQGTSAADAGGAQLTLQDPRG